jgi:hypothetical protein
MKISILALLATAVLATAGVIPCDRGTTHVDSSSEHDVTTDPPHLTCMEVCWPRHMCSGISFPVKLGKCWTCCTWHRPPQGPEPKQEELKDVDELD